jgi:hypothetical protein
MPRWLAVYLAVGVLVLAVAVGASAVGPVVYQGTKSGPGAYVYVGLTKSSTSFVLDVTTEPKRLPINVSWAWGSSCGNFVVRTHSPYRHVVRCKTPSTITVLAQLADMPAGSLSLAAVTGSHVSGQITFVVSLP